MMVNPYDDYYVDHNVNVVMRLLNYMTCSNAVNVNDLFVLMIRLRIEKEKDLW